MHAKCLRSVNRILQKDSKVTKFAFWIEDSPARIRFPQNDEFPDLLRFPSKHNISSRLGIPLPKSIFMPVNINAPISFTKHYNFCFNCMLRLQSGRRRGNCTLDGLDIAKIGFQGVLLEIIRRASAAHLAYFLGNSDGYEKIIKKALVLM